MAFASSATGLSARCCRARPRARRALAAAPACASHRGCAPPSASATPRAAAAAGVRLPARRAARLRLRAAAEGSAPNGAVVAEAPVAQAPFVVTGVAVFSSAPYVRDFLEAPLLAAYPKSRFIEARLSKDTVVLARSANVVCLFVNDDVDADVCAALEAQGVKLIAMRCAGFDRVDLGAAARHGLTVVRVPSYSPHAIAEHAVALLMTLNRKLHKAYARVREGNFTLNGLAGYDVHGKTVGIVGTGKIGTLTAKILGLGFGAKLLAYDAYVNPEFVAMGGEYVSMERLMQESDIISLHCPLNKNTFHLIGAGCIEKMKPGVSLINTSRGGLMDTRAVIQGLESGIIGSLGIDVYENEGPLFFKDTSAMRSSDRMRYWDQQMGVLLSLPNVLVTPHSAFLTDEALANIASTTLDNIASFSRGEPVLNAVKA